MNANCVKCPLCKRPVKLSAHGLMLIHWESLSKAGGGFRTLARRCPGGNKKPENVK